MTTRPVTDTWKIFDTPVSCTYPDGTVLRFRSAMRAAKVFGLRMHVIKEAAAEGRRVYRDGPRWQRGWAA